MKYTQHQIDEAYSQKEGLQDMIRHLNAMIDLAAENDLPDMGQMAQDMLSDVQTVLGEVQEIIDFDCRCQAETEIADYFGALI